MKKLLLIGLAIAMMVAGVAYAGPVMADVIHHASALGWDSGLSLTGMALTNIATQVTATSTVFQTPATNVSQTALAAAVTGVGTQDNALLTGATGAGVIIKYQTGDYSVCSSGYDLCAKYLVRHDQRTTRMAIPFRHFWIGVCGQQTSDAGRLGYCRTFLRHDGYHQRQLPQHFRGSNYPDRRGK